jgi:hypothetical protein
MAAADLAFSLIGICHILSSNPPPGCPQSNTKPGWLRAGSQLLRPGDAFAALIIVGIGF